MSPVEDLFCKLEGKRVYFFLQINSLSKNLVPSQRLWSIWLFASRIANCVYRFASYQQSRKPTISSAQSRKLLLSFPENNFTISLPTRRIGQHRRATRAPCRCYTADRPREILGAVLLPAVSHNAIISFCRNHSSHSFWDNTKNFEKNSIKCTLAKLTRSHI